MKGTEIKSLCLCLCLCLSLFFSFATFASEKDNISHFTGLISSIGFGNSSHNGVIKNRCWITLKTKEKTVIDESVRLYSHEMTNDICRSLINLRKDDLEVDIRVKNIDNVSYEFDQIVIRFYD
ncbi:hypothetical protein [Enterobacter ludwigii]